MNGNAEIKLKKASTFLISLIINNLFVVYYQLIINNLFVV